MPDLAIYFMVLGAEVLLITAAVYRTTRKG